MIESKSLQSLEFNKITEKISAMTSNEITAERCRNIIPETDINTINESLEIVSQACFKMTQKQYPSVSGLKDITGSVKRADIGGCLNATELLEISRLCRFTKALISFYKDESGEPQLLDTYFSSLTPITTLERNINDAIISENEIADNASPMLSAIRRKIKGTHDKIKSELNKLIHSSSHQNHLQEAIVTIRNGRYVLPVKSEHRGEIGGIVHDMSASGATVFIEPNVAVEANNILRELETKEKVEIENKNVNIQIAQNDDYSIIGWPLILGSY